MIAHDLALVPVPVDEHGLIVDDLDADAVLVMPAHQLPTGVVLTGERRRQLLAWADQRGLAIGYGAVHRGAIYPAISLLATIVRAQKGSLTNASGHAARRTPMCFQSAHPGSVPGRSGGAGEG